MQPVDPRAAIDLEDPEDRKWRHSVEGRLNFNTTEAVSRLQDDMRDVRDDVADIKRTQTASDAKLDRIEKWLMGDISTTGIPTPGIMQNVALFSKVWKWVLVLLGATATATIVNAVINLLVKTGALHP
jgi:hypothetical protein